MFIPTASRYKRLLTNIGNKQRMLLLIVTLLPFNALNAHTPYAQWDAYRVRHLQVLTTRSDLQADAIADKWVAVLAEHLPKSKAVVSRARNFVRMASLLKTDQAKVAVLSSGDAKAMFEGTAPFEEFGPIKLQVLLTDGAYLLVTRADLPESHGFLMVSTLLDEETGLNLAVPDTGIHGMKVHAGALAALDEHHELNQQ
ncbi:MAG: hypothetical protein AB8B97_24295 [Granulosicoccus sp.]